MELEAYVDAFIRVARTLSQQLDLPVEKVLEPASVIVQEVARDGRTERIRAERVESKEPAEPATEGQKAYLRKLGVEPKPGLSKDEASRLIDEVKRRRRA